MYESVCKIIASAGVRGAFVILCFALSGWAQSTGAILGTVQDPSGAVIVGATVRIVNAGTGVARPVTTNESGNFVAEALPVGTYDVTVEQKGFKPFTRRGIVLNVADRLTVDVRLELGAATEAVTVTAEAAPVQRETGDVSYLVGGQQITELALNGRNFISLLALSPGVASDQLADEQKEGWAGQYIYVNGLRADYNNWSIDGAFNVDPGSAGTIMNNYPSVDAIAEFKALTANYSAEYGTNGAMNNLIVLRSGTRNFHGTVYEFLRNDVLDARNTFATKKDPLKLNDFGYTIGGPFTIPGVYNTSKDKTFFFWSEEWRYRRQGQTILLPTVPVPFRNGDFSSLLPGTVLTNPDDPATGQRMLDRSGNPCIQSNIISSDCINPVAQAYFHQLWPLPTPGRQDMYYNYQTQLTLPYNFRQELIRVDHNFSERVKLVAHYIHDSVFEHYPNTLWWGGNLPTITTAADTPGENAMIKLTAILNPTLVNEVNYSISGANQTVLLYGDYEKGPALQFKEIWPDNRANRAPDVGLTGYGFMGSAAYPWNDRVKTHTIADTLSKVVGNHSLKLGGQYQYALKNQDAFGNTNGVFYPWGQLTGDPVADLLLNNGNWYSENQSQPRGYYRYHQIEAFVQDDWKVNSRLSFNIGLRYFYIPHTFERNNSISSWFPDRFDPAKVPDAMNGVVIAGQGGMPRGFVTNYGGRNWAPRFGFAYDPVGSGKTVLRGGFGMGYVRIQGNDTYSFINNPPFNNSTNVWLPPFDDPGSGSILGPGTPSLTAIDPNYKMPTTYSYSFGIQRELSPNAMLSVAYVATRALHLEYTRDINQPLPVPAYDFDPLLNSGAVNTDALRPYQGFGAINWQENTARSWYDSLQVDLKKRFAHGLQFEAAYTWSKSIDIASGFGARPQNSYNLRAQKGLSDFDRPQLLTFNYIYNLPFFHNAQPLVKGVFGDWEISGITTLQSGGVATPGFGIGGVGLASRPNIIGNVNSGPRTPEQWFNTAAFEKPADGFFGSAGRGTIRLPGLNQWNFSLMKKFTLHENVKLQLRFESFNLFNHPNYLGPNTGFGSGGFGQITSAHGPRILQFGLKVLF